MSQDPDANDADAREFSGSSVVQGKGGMFPQQKSEKSLENDDQSADFGLPQGTPFVEKQPRNRFGGRRKVRMFRTWKRDGSWGLPFPGLFV